MSLASPSQAPRTRQARARCGYNLGLGSQAFVLLCTGDVPKKCERMVRRLVELVGRGPLPGRAPRMRATNTFLSFFTLTSFCSRKHLIFLWGTFSRFSHLPPTCGSFSQERAPCMTQKCANDSDTELTLLWVPAHTFALRVSSHYVLALSGVSLALSSVGRQKAKISMSESADSETWRLQNKRCFLGVQSAELSDKHLI